MSSSKMLNQILRHGHTLSMDQLADALEMTNKVMQAEMEYDRKRFLANPDPKSIQMARARRARGMSYDVELLKQVEGE